MAIVSQALRFDTRRLAPEAQEIDMKFPTKIMIAMAIGVLGASATGAFAETPWEQSHPRRDQVNDRLATQHQRINHELREGELTRPQAGRLRAEDHTIRREERAMSSLNHGHITRSEQKVLNQQENAVNRQIGR